jgi:hypothetical protein
MGVTSLVVIGKKRLMRTEYRYAWACAGLVARQSNYFFV